MVRIGKATCYFLRVRFITWFQLQMFCDCVYQITKLVAFYYALQNRKVFCATVSADLLPSHVYILFKIGKTSIMQHALTSESGLQ